MKRVKSARICETLHFTSKRDVSPASAALLVKHDIEKYKKRLEMECTPYRIIEESTQADGAVIVKVLRQYRHHPTGMYLDSLG